MAESVNVKVKLTRNKIILILLIFSFLIGVFLYSRFVTCFGPFSVTCLSYREVIYNFRTNLKDAQKVPALPDDASINSEFSSNEVQNITIAYKPDPIEIKYITLEAVEVVNKLKLFYLSFPNRSSDVTFNVIQLNTFNNVTGTSENPVVVIKGLSQSTGNQVSFTNHVVTIEGRSLSELDSATERFVLAVFGVKI